MDDVKYNQSLTRKVRFESQKHCSTIVEDLKYVMMEEEVS